MARFTESERLDLGGCASEALGMLCRIARPWCQLVVVDEKARRSARGTEHRVTVAANSPTSFTRRPDIRISWVSSRIAPYADVNRRVL